MTSGMAEYQFPKGSSTPWALRVALPTSIIWAVVQLFSGIARISTLPEHANPAPVSILNSVLPMCVWRQYPWPDTTDGVLTVPL